MEECSVLVKAIQIFSNLMLLISRHTKRSCRHFLILHPESWLMVIYFFWSSFIWSANILSPYSARNCIRDSLMNRGLRTWARQEWKGTVLAGRPDNKSLLNYTSMWNKSSLGGPQGLRGKSLYLLVRWLRLPEVFCQRIKELHLCLSYVLNCYVDLRPWFGVS